MDLAKVQQACCEKQLLNDEYTVDRYVALNSFQDKQ